MLFFAACVCGGEFGRGLVLFDCLYARFFLWFPGSPDLDSSSFDFASSYCVWIVTSTHPGLILELLDQKARGFVV
jgi:hypothetical protein